MRKVSAVVVSLAIALSAFSAQVPAPVPQPLPPLDPAAAEVKQLVDASTIQELRWPDFTDYRKHLDNFYRPVNYTYVWLRNGRPTPQALAVIDLFRRADAKGINSVDYDAPRWDARLQKLRTGRAPSADLALFDVEVSATLMRYISDLHIGRINPRNIQFDLDIEHKKYYLPKLLMDIKDAANVNTILDQVEPPYEDYKRLRVILGTYMRIAADGDQKPFPAIKLLKPGESWEAVPDLAAFLQRVGDLPTTTKFDPKKKIYDGDLVTAVKRFQHRHGLVDDGKISAATLKQLNVPLSRRVQQIRLAMERWRWAPAEFARPPIIVNVPEFRLRCWDEQQHVALPMNVVVGQAFEHQTPIFQGDLRYVVFRPYWNVPPSIQRKELAPKVEKDHSYLSAHGYEVVDQNDQVVTAMNDDVVASIKSLRYSLRQKPGPENALGAVKFLFPNRNNVYLHSTPSQSLFSRSRRDFSHGCIRVEEPAKLAAWVLRDKPEWTPEKIAATMKGKEDNVQVNLAQPIPILILYATVVAPEEGDVHFFDDIYGHDATLENALAQGYPYPA